MPKPKKQQPQEQEAGAAPDQPLHVKYRPQDFEQVVGQDAAVKSLRSVLGGGSPPHSFLFTGPSGVGKTTLARILARWLGADERNVVEIDAATHSGVEAMREVTSMAQYQGFGENPARVFIVDECHALSKQTWQAMLKAIEEPPPHAYWCLCTTEAEKVPRTIVTRCHAYELKPVKRDVLGDFLGYVRDEEGLSVGDDVLDYVAEKAEGSVRQALVYLSAARECGNRKEAHELLQQAADNPELIDLARRIADGRGLDWAFVCSVVRAMEHSPESARMVIVNYLGTALLGARSEKQAVRLLEMLECFNEPYRQGEKVAPLLLSLGRCVFR